MKQSLSLFFIFFLSSSIFGQQVLDDFTRVDNAAVGGGWTEASTDAAEDASIVSNQLEITSGGTSGRDYVHQDVSALFETTYNNAASALVWEFNMRSSRSSPSGFGSGNYGMAFVLGSDNNDVTMGNGYAVVLGNSGSPDNLKLVSYTGGIILNSSLTDIITSSSSYQTEHLSVRVIFIPSSGTWSLYVRDDGSSFADPSTLTNANLDGSVVNTTHTNIDLPHVICLFNHGTVASETVEFDNINVPLECTPPTTQATTFATANVTTTSLDLSFTRGNGDGGVIVVAKAGSAVDSEPISGSSYLPSLTFGTGDEIGSGNYVVYNGNPSPALANSGNISISGLTPGETYHFSIYEYANTDICYLIPALTGSETTPCTVPDDVASYSGLASNTEAVISWTLPTCFDEFLIVAKDGSSVTSTPSGDGTAYTANAAFGNGSDLGGSEFAVYKGTGTTETVTALTNGNQYFFKIFTRKGTSWNAGVEIDITPISILWQENFDGSSTITPSFSSTPDAPSGSDYYGITNEASISATFTGDDNNFLAAQDTDHSGLTNPTSSLTVTYDNIDITGATDLHFCLDVAEDDDGSSQDWDANDQVLIEVDIDNANNYRPVFQIEASALNTEPGLDIDCDGTPDGTAITDVFTTYCVAVFGTGTYLDLRITIDGLVAGDEDIAMDNLQLYDGSTSIPVAATTYNCLGNLPVELISFNAIKTNEGIVLDWKTATEFNNDRFIIQRSTDGQSFEDLGIVLGAGTTTEIQSYDFLDPSPINGINYYRLKQVDFDEKFEYSNVITIEIEKQLTSIDVYPNPSTGRYNLKLSDNWTSQTTLQVFDMTGRMVYNQSIDNNTSELNLEHLTNGTYFLKFANQNDVLTTRIVKMQ